MRHVLSTLLSAGLASAAALVAVACNPYDPNLGDTPFRCGTDEPRCPSGYECVEYSPAQKVCERAGGGDDGPDARDDDASGLTCNDDSSIEPNDTVSDAFLTPIPAFNSCTTMVSLAICPDSDKDLYRFGVEQNGKNLRATVTTDVAQGQLTLQVQNGQGATIANGAALDGTRIQVAVPNLAVGTYYIQVASPPGSGIKNNYSIEINTCDEAGCPTPCQ